MYTLIKYIVLVLLQLIVLGDSIPAQNQGNGPKEKEDTLCCHTIKKCKHGKLCRGFSNASSDEAQFPDSKIWIVNKNIIFGE